MTLESEVARDHIAVVWEQAILPTLHDYIAIPNVSPAFDPHWATVGHMDRAVSLLLDWARARPINGLTIERVDLPGRTPILLAEVPASVDACDREANGPPPTVLLYGHLDKQPPMDGWRAGLGPWEPVVVDDRLYGRGGADDGYSMFAALTAIEAVQVAGGRHARCVLLIEASEESGSPDLPAHLEQIGDRLGRVDLVVCLDSGAATYDRMWLTTSLRGVANLSVRVDVLTEGVHSGAAGGVVPSSFRIQRLLLDRLEDAESGTFRVPQCIAEIPEQRRAQAEETGALLGHGLQDTFPFAAGVRAMGDTPTEQLLNRTWRPALEVIAADGLPLLGSGGNVARPFTTLQLSLRLPPTVDVAAAIEAVRTTLTAEPTPHGAPVQVEVQAAMQGWNAPDPEPWLAAAIEQASVSAFGQPARAMGEGGSIPFMAMLGERFPAAQFVVTGVLGPGSNAHGPNEFLHIAYARRLTEAVAFLLDAHASH